MLLLGDIVSSQTISDTEWKARIKRLRSIAGLPRYLAPDSCGEGTGADRMCGVLAVNGNHDTGYGADGTRAQLDRFEAVFGKINARHFFSNHTVLVTVNAQVLDGAQDSSLEHQPWQTLRQAARLADEGMEVVLALHIPLWKPDGSCPGDDTVVIKRRGSRNIVKDQTHLSRETTDFILTNLRPTVVLTGHDHDGCVYRHNDRTVEYTLRAAQGHYDNCGGLLHLDPTGQMRSTVTTSCLGVTEYLLTIFILLAIYGLFLPLRLMYTLLEDQLDQEDPESKFKRS